MAIGRLILLFSRTKVEGLVVYHMISCFPMISLRFFILVSCSVASDSTKGLLYRDAHYSI